MDTTRRGYFGMVAGCAAVPFVPLVINTDGGTFKGPMTAKEVLAAQDAMMLEYWEKKINPPIFVGPDNHFDIIRW